MENLTLSPDDLGIILQYLKEKRLQLLQLQLEIEDLVTKILPTIKTMTPEERKIFFKKNVDIAGVIICYSLKDGVLEAVDGLNDVVSTAIEVVSKAREDAKISFKKFALIILSDIAEGVEYLNNILKK